jgi:hypothetical protein
VTDRHSNAGLAALSLGSDLFSVEPIYGVTTNFEESTSLSS